MTTPLTAPLIPDNAVRGGRASTASHFLVTVTVNGVQIGEFDAMSGGDPTNETSKHVTGGRRRVALPGIPDVADVVVRRAFYHQRDHSIARQLRALIDRAEVTISRQPLDGDRRPFGRPDLFSGVLAGVTYPETDQESTDVSMLELTVTVDGQVG